jgi:myosin heavy subunit
MAREDNFDLINLDGPLTVEAIVRTLQQRFMDGHCYAWIGPVLLCINPFEAPGPAMHSVLKQLCERILQDMASDLQPRAVIFHGPCGSGKTFTADQLLVKMFQNTQRTDWLQDIRKVIIGTLVFYTRECYWRYLRPSTGRCLPWC